MSVEPLPEDRDDLSLSLSEWGLSDDIASHLAAQARPAVLLITSETEEDELPLGASKIGGRPDLVSGTAWPARPAYPDASRRAERQPQARGAPSRRIAEATFLDVAGARRSFQPRARGASQRPRGTVPAGFFRTIRPLRTRTGRPSEGRLLLFYDFWEMPEEFVPEASVGWRLIWDQTPVSELVRAPIPTELSSISNDEWSCVFRAARISARSVITPIPPSDDSWDAFPLDDDDALETYEEWLEQFGRPDMKDRDNHQLGGFPQPLQNGLQARSQLAANGIYCGSSQVWQTDEAKELLKSANEWRLVLQIGVDRHAGIKPPGAYYVIMREQDIAARRFDLARVTYQCD
jgi:hypothetical protein